MKKFFIALICTLAALSCSSSGDKPSGDKPSGNEKGGGWPCSYFIDIFVDVSDMVFYSLDEGDGVEELHYPAEGDPNISLYLKGHKIMGEEAARIREDIGDVGGKYYKDTWGPVEVATNNFVGIDVTSDAQFNDVAPGESLGEIVVMNWHTAAPLIQAKRGYEPKGYSKTLSRITAQDLYLMTSSFWLTFTEQPAIKEHNITVSLMNKDTTITATGHFVFK